LQQVAPTFSGAPRPPVLDRRCPIRDDPAMASWTPGWDEFPAALLDFWTERHLCALAVVKPDGRPHVVPVGVALDHDERCAWVIMSRTSYKARLLGRGADGGMPVAASQVDGARWSTLEGTGRLLDDDRSVRRAEERYAARYRVPRPNPQRVALRVEVDRFLVSTRLA
jgi:PPOX class probable F420-dependent enzyme